MFRSDSRSDESRAGGGNGWSVGTFTPEPTSRLGMDSTLLGVLRVRDRRRDVRRHRAVHVRITPVPGARLSLRDLLRLLNQFDEQDLLVLREKIKDFLELLRRER